MQGQAQSMDATASPYPGPLFGATDYARQTNQIHDNAIIAHQVLVAVAGSDGAYALALLLAVCCQPSGLLLGIDLLIAVGFVAESPRPVGPFWHCVVLI